MPRSFMSRSWLSSTEARSSSSEILGYGGGRSPARNAACCASRQDACAAGAVV